MFFQAWPQIHNPPASWVLELQVYTAYLTQNIYPDLFYLRFHRTIHLNELQVRKYTILQNKTNHKSVHETGA